MASARYPTPNVVKATHKSAGKLRESRPCLVVQTLRNPVNPGRLVDRRGYFYVTRRIIPDLQFVICKSYMVDPYNYFWPLLTPIYACSESVRIL